MRERTELRIEKTESLHNAPVTATMRAVVFVLSLVVAESLAANWTTVWSNYKKEPPVDVTMVFVNLFVRSLGNVNTNDMTYDVQLTYREQWRDPELAYDAPIPGKANFTYKTVSRDLVWTPDTFFSNEVSGHDFKLMSVSTNPVLGSI